MANAVEPTLSKLVAIYLSSAKADQLWQLPSQSFGYGLHWNVDRMTIIVHFPLLESRSQIGSSLRFCQMMLAEHLITPHGSRTGRYPPSQDGMFLLRWRLVIALLSVRAHAEHLQNELGWNAMTTRLVVSHHEVGLPVHCLRAHCCVVAPYLRP